MVKVEADMYKVAAADYLKMVGFAAECRPTCLFDEWLVLQ